LPTITIGDPRGDLITLHDLEVRISMSSLLRGRIHVKALTLAHLEIWNRPLPRERWRIPRVPGLPVWPTVDLLRVDRITLDAAVLGAPATLSLTGRLQPIAGSRVAGN
jgi:autotransporter translocation and assembly factor TamB